MVGIDKKELLKTLKSFFGFNAFKGQQDQIIGNILQGKDAFVNAHRWRKKPVLSVTGNYAGRYGHNSLPIDCANEKSG